MRAAVYHGPGDVRVEDVPRPEIESPGDALVRVTHTCVCGSDLWPYRGESDRDTPPASATSRWASSRPSATTSPASPPATACSRRS